MNNLKKQLILSIIDISRAQRLKYICLLNIKAAECFYLGLDDFYSSLFEIIVTKGFLLEIRHEKIFFIGEDNGDAIFVPFLLLYKDELRLLYKIISDDGVDYEENDESTISCSGGKVVIEDTLEVRINKLRVLRCFKDNIIATLFNNYDGKTLHRHILEHFNYKTEVNCLKYDIKYSFFC